MAKSLSEAQRAALAKGRAARAANVAKGSKGSKGSKPRASKASSSKGSKPRASKLSARVAALEARVDNHGVVLSDLVGIVEQHGARLNAVEAAFGMGSAQGHGARTVMMPAMGAN